MLLLVRTPAQQNECCCHVSNSRTTTNIMKPVRPSLDSTSQSLNQCRCRDHMYFFQAEIANGDCVHRGPVCVCLRVCGYPLNTTQYQNCTKFVSTRHQYINDGSCAHHFQSKFQHLPPKSTSTEKRKASCSLILHPGQ